MSLPRPRLLAAALGGLLLASAPSQAGDDALTLFAAASMTDAMTEAAKAFTAAGGSEVKLVFGSSSTLAKQIENGGPADIFISADQKWMDYLDDRDYVVDDSRSNLAGNALVLIAPTGSSPADRPRAGRGPRGRAGQRQAGDGRPRARAGRPLRQGRAGRTSACGTAVQPHTVFTADVREALNFVDKGEAAAGIVYATDAAISQNVRTVATFPADSHDPIVYPVALIQGHDEGMPQAFLDFLDSDAGSAILKKHGFVVPAPNS